MARLAEVAHRASDSGAVVFGIFATAAVLIVGVIIPRSPLLAFTAVVLLAGLPMIIKFAWVRLGMIVIGALLVFQGTSNGAKLGYLGFALVCVLISLINLVQSDDDALRAFRPMILWAIPISLWLLATGPIAVGNGASVSNWTRDVLGYLLLVLLPIVGLDTARNIGSKHLGRAIGVLSVIVAVGIAADWLNRRGATDATGRFILSSGAFAAFALCYTLVRAALGPSRWAWSLGALITSAALLITGSRTNIVLLAVAALAMLGRKRKARIPIAYVATGLVVGIPALLYLLPRVGSLFLTNTAFLTQRFDALMAVVNGDIAGDQSFQDRQQQYRWAYETFQAAPLTGSGPGHIYPIAQGSFSVDSPWAIPAKIGIIGCVFLLAYLWAIVRSIRAARTPMPSPAFTAAWGWWTVMLALLPFGPLIEDKGTGLALAMMICLCVAVSRENRVLPSAPLDSDELGARQISQV